MSSHDLLAEYVSHLPAPGSTPGERLAHTVAAFDHLPDGAVLPGLGGPIVLLRRLDNRDVVATLAHLAAGRPDEEFAVRATSGVYGHGICTGLTWADIRALTETTATSHQSA